MTRDDIDLDGTKGRLCIFSQADKPCASMLVFVHREETEGCFIEYIRPTRLIQGIVGPVGLFDLTPIEHFGRSARYKPSTGVLEVLPDPNCEHRATYHNGDRRSWQGDSHTSVHESVQGIFRELYA